MLNRMFNHTRLMQKSLDVSWMRNEVIAHNIANVDTPGFKSRGLAFEDEFRAALLRDRDTSLPRPNISLRRLASTDAIQAGPDLTGRMTRDRHLPLGQRTSGNPLDVQPQLFTRTDTTMKMDGNNVDIDREMNEAAKNTVYYYTMLNKVSSELGRLRTVMRDIR
jgi:flagellar basal-body rod protein FlgB